MKAISLWQPWASAIAMGLKTIETRGWETKYRGPLAIHATKNAPPIAKQLFEQFRLRFGFNATWDSMPRGCVVATCELADVLPMKQLHDMFLLNSTEEAFGDYSPGRFAWILHDIQPVNPFPCRGAQGLFNVKLPQ